MSDSQSITCCFIMLRPHTQKTDIRSCHCNCTFVFCMTQYKEEEPYTCARSCGCPSSFNSSAHKWRDVLLWITSNRVEWLAGITTGLTAVPTAVAFAILAGLKPSVGLRGTWIIMLVMALFGGKGADMCKPSVPTRSANAEVVILRSLSEVL